VLASSALMGQGVLPPGDPGWVLFFLFLPSPPPLGRFSIVLRRTESTGSSARDRRAASLAKNCDKVSLKDFHNSVVKCSACVQSREGNTETIRPPIVIGGLSNFEFGASVL
jgi:hypothetical protein